MSRAGKGGGEEKLVLSRVIKTLKLRQIDVSLVRCTDSMVAQYRLAVKKSTGSVKKITS